jgi:hypothetical protein
MKSPDLIDRGFLLSANFALRGLVLATRVEHGQNHQVGIGEQPFFSLRTGGLRSARERTEVLAAREALEMLQANSRKPGDFIRCE